MHNIVYITYSCNNVTTATKSIKVTRQNDVKKVPPPSIVELSETKELMFYIITFLSIVKSCMLEIFS